jgi:hypothetical protein
MRLVNDWNGDRAKAVSEAGGSSPLASFWQVSYVGDFALRRAFAQ